MNKKDIVLKSHIYTFIHNQRCISLIRDDRRVFHLPLPNQPQTPKSLSVFFNEIEHLTGKQEPAVIANAICFLKQYTSKDFEGTDETISHFFKILTCPVIVHFQPTSQKKTERYPLNPIHENGQGPQGSKELIIPNMIISLEELDIIATITDSTLTLNNTQPTSDAWQFLTKFKMDGAHRKSHIMKEKLLRLSQADLTQAKLAHNRSDHWRFKSFVDFYERLHQKKLW